MNTVENFSQRMVHDVGVFPASYHKSLCPPHKNTSQAKLKEGYYILINLHGTLG